jgi:hypothetical protein
VAPVAVDVTSPSLVQLPGIPVVDLAKKIADLLSGAVNDQIE